jgi:hypothetical protein
MARDERSTGIQRRGFLAAGVGLAAVTAVAMLPEPAEALGVWHPDWRFCNKCFGLVRDLGQVRNRCPAGGTHVVQGWIFGIPFTNSTDYHAGETSSEQSDWRQCATCGVLYYHGFPGVCAGNGRAAHRGTPTQNILTHDLNPVPRDFQSAWRFCFKCSSLYFDGYQPNRGVCPGNPGWGHAAAGFVFDLQVYSYH